MASIKKLLVEYISLKDNPNVTLLERLHSMNEKEIRKLILKESVTSNTVWSVVGLFLFFPGAWALYKGIQLVASKCVRKCSHNVTDAVVNTAGKQLCVASCKMKEQIAQLKLYKPMLAKCKNTKDPEKCRKLVIKKMGECKVKIAQNKGTIIDAKVQLN